jgi:hypothetical protein
MRANAVFTAILGAVTALVSVQGAALPTNFTSSLQKRAVTTIEQCKVSGQIALTFDGEHTFHLLASEPTNLMF